MRRSIDDPPGAAGQNRTGRKGTPAGQKKKNRAQGTHRAEEEKPGKETFLCAGSADETPGAAAGQNRTGGRNPRRAEEEKTGAGNPLGIGNARRGGVKSNRGAQEPAGHREKIRAQGTFLCTGSIDDPPGAGPISFTWAASSENFSLFRPAAVSPVGLFRPVGLFHSSACFARHPVSLVGFFHLSACFTRRPVSPVGLFHSSACFTHRRFHPLACFIGRPVSLVGRFTRQRFPSLVV